jgi:hypothetical protein
MAEVRQYKSDIMPKGMFTKYMYTMISDMVHPSKDIIKLYLRMDVSASHPG